MRSLAEYTGGANKVYGTRPKELAPRILGCALGEMQTDTHMFADRRMPSRWWEQRLQLHEHEVDR